MNIYLRGQTNSKYFHVCVFVKFVYLKRYKSARAYVFTQIRIFKRGNPSSLTEDRELEKECVSERDRVRGRVCL